ncbi:heme exporter protein CcmB [Alteromonadaceae bacterium M269]|nr:heme exporter protein CcmB [Alteromonadaceae bacterium M269]
MNKALVGIAKRDFSLAFRQSSELLQPLIFCLLVVSLFPLGVGPGPVTLQKISGGIIWVTAILSSLLGLERLFRDDFRDGWLEQVSLSDCSQSLAAVVKITVHWLTSFLPLLLLSPLLALFLNMTMSMYTALVLTLLIGTPLISLVGAIAVALTVGLNKGGVLLALLLLPIFTPLLIFATSAIEAASLNLPYVGQLAIIGALTLLALAFSPFATAFALKVSQH